MPKDARFAKLASDPRFIKPKKVAQKVQVDERFANLLDDATKAEKRVDKRGKRVNASKAEKEDLKRFYKVHDEPQQQPEASTSKQKQKHAAGAAGMSAGERALKMARGELMEESSDEEESEEEDDAELESDDDSALEGQSDSEADGSEFSIDLDEDPDNEAAEAEDFPDDADEPESETEEDIDTTRLALVNMDWDHIRAVDLFKVLQSALQATHPQGSVRRVSIYPSEFGKERMEREEREGPPKELFANEDGSNPQQEEDLADLDEDDIDEKMVVQEAEDKGEEINSKALRRYQLERLRYYYAVAEFDSVKSARAAFLEVQGTEFERSANIFELRAIPDDMQFEDKPKEVATSTDDHSAYEGGLDYVTTALRHSKVKLTWDQDDPRRSRVTRIDFTKMPKDKVDQINYADYLASDSSEEESEEDGEGEGGLSRAAQFRAALGLSAEPKNSKKSASGKGPSGDMEITFRPALEGGADNDEDGDFEEDEEKEETTIERYKRKEKERRERKKQARLAETGEAQPDEEQEDEFFEGFQDEDAAFAAALEAHDAGVDDDAASSRQSKKLSKGAKRAAKAKEAEEAAKQRAELELLVDDKDDARHFDMEKIWKAEREEASGTSRSAKRKRGARAAKKEAEAAQAKAQDQFVLDTKDNRFKNLHEDPAFAIDPSNPKYKKTKNMQLLLDETRKARDNKIAAAGAHHSTEAPSKAQQANATSANGSADRDLDSLVSAIKRKSDGAKDKKSKKRKL